MIPRSYPGRYALDRPGARRVLRRAGRYLALAFGAYAAFGLAVALLCLFLLDAGGPWSVDPAAGEASPARGGFPAGASAALADLALIALFGLSDSLVAGPGFKRLWAGIAPVALARSVHLLSGSLCLILVMALWRPIGGEVWRLEGLSAALAYALFALGAGICVVANFSHEDGRLTAAWNSAFGRARPEPRFRTPLLHRIVRHPLRLGGIVMLFAAPVMTQGHLLFAAATTLGLLIGLHVEERSLRERFGRVYAAYRRRTPMLLPIPRRSWLRARRGYPRLEHLEI